jgi:hypothetical protein
VTAGPILRASATMRGGYGGRPATRTGKMEESICTQALCGVGRAWEAAYRRGDEVALQLGFCSRGNHEEQGSGLPFIGPRPPYLKRQPDLIS